MCPVSEPTQHYCGEAGRRYHFDKRGIPATAFDWVARLRATKFAGHVRSTDVVFEFGVGAGWNLAALNCARRLGCDITGFLAPELQRRGIEFVPSAQQMAPGSVDVAICHHVLEHVLDPAATLLDLRRLLRPGGTLWVATPFEKERRYRRYDPAEPNHHLFSWNAQTLGNLVAESGFKLDSVRIGQFGYDRFAAAWACRLHLGEPGFRLIRTLSHGLRPGCEVRLVAHTPAIVPA